MTNKLDKLKKDGIDLLYVERKRQTENSLELELAAIKEREEIARQTAKEQEETARQKEQEETKRQVQKTKEEEETKRQAQAHSQPSTQQDGGEGLGQASRVGHRPTLPKLPAIQRQDGRHRLIPFPL